MVKRQAKSQKLSSDLPMGLCCGCVHTPMNIVIMKTILLGAEKVAQLIKDCPCKQEDLNSESIIKKPCVVECVVIPVLWRWKWPDPWGSWPVSLIGESLVRYSV